MLFWKKIKSKLLGKPYFQLKTEHKIVPAFICDGVQYYQFEDIFALASGRAFVATHCIMNFQCVVHMNIY